MELTKTFCYYHINYTSLDGNGVDPVPADNSEKLFKKLKFILV